jgi:hypothetical protein
MYARLADGHVVLLYAWCFGMVAAFFNIMHNRVA